MNNGVIRFRGIDRSIHNGEWGFRLNGIEYSGYNTRETARNAYRRCMLDMFDLFNKYGCSNGQEEYLNLKRFSNRIENIKKNT